LQEKIDKFGIPNIDLHVMDAAALEFRREYFDHVVCSFRVSRPMKGGAFRRRPE